MNKPQLRFKGFNDEWESTPIGIDLTLRRGLTYSPTKICKPHEGVLVLRSSNIDIDTYVNNEDDVYVSEEAINIPFIEEGDLIFTAANGSTRLVGKHCVVGELSCKTVHGGFMLAGKTPNPNFTQAWLSAPWYINSLSSFISGGNGALGNLKATDLLSHVEPYPTNRKEREKIGDYFKRIDEMITEVEREIGRLEKMKQASLQKMFPRPGETTPEIRFAGFTDPWKLKRLGSLTERITRKNGSESQLALTISSLLGLVDQETYFNHRVASKDVSNYYLIRNGEFAYNKSTSDGFPWGSVKRLDRYEKGVLSTLYIVFRIISDRLNSEFLCVYFDTNLWYEHLSLNAAEGARNHGLLNIAVEDFFSLDILIPDLEEQKAIGEYFRNLDTLLDTKRQKLVKLRNIKQACLDKMFVNTIDI